MRYLIFASIFLLLNCSNDSSQLSDEECYMCDPLNMSYLNADVAKRDWKPNLRGEKTKEGYRMTPLLSAISVGHLEFSDFLIAKTDGLNVQQPETGLSPLMLSVVFMFFQRFPVAAFFYSKSFYVENSAEGMAKEDTGKVFKTLRLHPKVSKKLKDAKGNTTELYEKIGNELNLMKLTLKQKELMSKTKSKQDFFKPVSAPEKNYWCWGLCYNEFMQKASLEEIEAEIKYLQKQNLKSLNQYDNSKASHEQSPQGHSLPLLHALNRPDVIKILLKSGADPLASDQSGSYSDTVLNKTVDLYLMLYVSQIYKEDSSLISKEVLNFSLEEISYASDTLEKLELSIKYMAEKTKEQENDEEDEKRINRKLKLYELIKQLK